MGRHKCEGCIYRGEHREMGFRLFGVCTKEHNLVEAEKVYKADKCPYAIDGFKVKNKYIECDRLEKKNQELEAETEKLNAENKSLITANENLTTDLTSAKADIELFKTAQSQFISDINACREKLKIAKAEAVKSIVEIIVADYPEMEYYLNGIVKEILEL